MGRPSPDRLAAATGRTVAALGRALADLTAASRPPRQPQGHPEPVRKRLRREDKPALFTAIRRDAHAEGLSIRALAELHGVHRRTVRQALASPTPPERRTPSRRESQEMARLSPVIDTLLSRDQHPAHQPVTARAVWERLLDEHDSELSYSTVNAYVVRRRQQHPDESAPAPGQSARRRPGNILSTATHPGAGSRHHRELLAAIRRRPAAHGLDGSYASMTAFVLGADAATSGSILTGFREWLVVRLDGGNNLAWTALVRDLTPSGFVRSSSVENEASSVATLFDLLDEFMDQRDRVDGLLRIFNAYQSWLNAQDAHHPDPP
jgi:hypothetical protein